MSSTYIYLKNNFNDNAKYSMDINLITAMKTCRDIMFRKQVNVTR